MKTREGIAVDSPHRGQCHCGAVRFEAKLLDGLNTARRCNCSICRMRGAVAVSALLADFRLVAGESDLSLYQFGTNTAKHFFCRHCGIYTHHQRRSTPDHFGINVACLEGLSPFDILEVDVLDGTNHPRDHGQGAKASVFGTLRFTPT